MVSYTTMAKVPVVNKETCIGCGLCVTIAPKTFKLDAEGKAEVISAPGDNEKTIQEAIDSCPVAAIFWKETK